MSKPEVVAVIAQVMPALLIAIVVDAGLQARLAELRRRRGRQGAGPVAFWYAVIGSAGLTELGALFALSNSEVPDWGARCLIVGACVATIALCGLILYRVRVWSRPREVEDRPPHAFSAEDARGAR
ncbi:MAG TPA: hypothetical protein VF218_10675 [Acidothermaceae bacterium]|jgi:hypothetical protein